MPTLEENVNRVKAAKTAIGNAITAKGGTVGANDGLEDFASDVATITNQYTAGDEGKVVNNGALVPQTARANDITENGTYDTTLNNSINVKVNGIMYPATSISGKTKSLVEVTSADAWCEIEPSSNAIILRCYIPRKSMSPANLDPIRYLDIVYPEDYVLPIKRFTAANCKCYCSKNMEYTYDGTNYTFPVISAVSVTENIRTISINFSTSNLFFNTLENAPYIVLKA